MFRRKPLDAITQEVMISLADEPERWRVMSARMLGRLVRHELMREDRLFVSLSESLVAPWPIYAASVVAKDASYHPTGRDLRAIRQAVLRWLYERENASADRVRAFLAKAR